MKKLPKIYQNNVNKSFNNNKKVCYLKNEIINNNLSVDEVLDNIFNSIGYPYNIDVIINTNNNIYETNIISRKDNCIVTLDNDVINLSDINSIVIK